MKDIFRKLAVLFVIGFAFSACGGGGNPPAAPTPSVSQSLVGKTFVLSQENVSTLNNQCSITIALSDDMNISFQKETFALTNLGEEYLSGRWSEPSPGKIKMEAEIEGFLGPNKVITLVLQVAIQGDKISFSLADDPLNVTAGCSKSKSLGQVKVSGDIINKTGIDRVSPNAPVVIQVTLDRPNPETVAFKVYKFAKFPIPFLLDFPVEKIEGGFYAITAWIKDGDETMAYRLVSSPYTIRLDTPRHFNSVELTNIEPAPSPRED